MQHGNQEFLLKKTSLINILTEDLGIALGNINLSKREFFLSYDEFLDELVEHLPTPDSLRAIFLANRERNLLNQALDYDLRVFSAIDYKIQYKDLAEYCEALMKISNPELNKRIFVTSFVIGQYHVCPILIHLKNKKIEVTLIESVANEDQIQAFEENFTKNLGAAKGLIDLVYCIPNDYTIQAGSFECGAFTAYAIDILSLKTDAELTAMRESIRVLGDKDLIQMPDEIVRAAQSKKTINQYIGQITARNIEGHPQIKKDIEDAFTNLSVDIRLKEAEGEKIKKLNAYIWYAASQYFDSAITYVESMDPDVLVSKLDRISKGDPDKYVSTDMPSAKRAKVDFSRE